MKGLAGPPVQWKTMASAAMSTAIRPARLGAPGVVRERAAVPWDRLHSTINPNSHPSGTASPSQILAIREPMATQAITTIRSRSNPRHGIGSPCREGAGVVTRTPETA